MDTEMFQTRVLETLENHSGLLVSLVRAVNGLRETVEITNSTTEELVELLTPEEEQQAGPSIAEAMLEMATRIERQTVVIRDLTNAVIQAQESVDATA